MSGAVMNISYFTAAAYCVIEPTLWFRRHFRGANVVGGFVVGCQTSVISYKQLNATFATA
ncbi:hypothetical protein ACU8KH_00290 [Lachancea thermotolerans]